MKVAYRVVGCDTRGVEHTVEQGHDLAELEKVAKVRAIQWKLRGLKLQMMVDGNFADVDLDLFRNWKPSDGPDLREARKKKGLGLREMAKLAGVSHGHLSEVERGKAPLTIEVNNKIYEQLGLITELDDAAFYAKVNPATSYLARLRPGESKRTAKTALKICAELLELGGDPQQAHWWKCSYRDSQKLRIALIARYSTRSANNRLAAYRSVLREAWRCGMMNAEEYEAARDVKDLKGLGDRPGRHLEVGEIFALFRACGTTRAGTRNAAIMGLLYGCGMRRDEVIKLNVDSFQRAESKVVFQGKGGKERVAYLNQALEEGISEWLVLRGSAPGPMFTHTDWKGPERRRLTAQSIWLICQALAKKAGVRPFSPHDLRRTYAGVQLDNGTDLVTVSRLMGHESVRTTAGYDRRGEDRQRQAAERMHVPIFR